jgi:hypothetical protein
MNSHGYDIIGDIHGQAGKLRALLRKLGYTERGSDWVPPAGRTALFIGDLIDRGPEQAEVVRIVRSMIDAGHARSVMGNHEFNAIGYATPDPASPGHFLRPHSRKNTDQHRSYLDQVGEGSALHREHIDWFRTLPVTLDLGDLRLVHAWWHQPHVDAVATAVPPGAPMPPAFIEQAHRRGTAAFAAMEGLTKGLEIPLPEGYSFRDHAGHERREVRTRWWHESPGTYRDIALVGREERDQVPDHPLPAGYVGAPVEGAPVFVGHYWLDGTPEVQSRKVACVDYSAAGRGPLVAYRWDGEAELDGGRFVEAGAN